MTIEDMKTVWRQSSDFGHFIEQMPPFRLVLICAMVIALPVMLMGCGPGHVERVAVAFIPDLPRVDPALMKRPENPNCVKDKRAAIPVKALASERDCFRDATKKAHGHIIALQDSVSAADGAVDKLRASQSNQNPTK